MRPVLQEEGLVLTGQVAQMLEGLVLVTVVHLVILGLVQRSPGAMCTSRTGSPFSPSTPVTMADASGRKPAVQREAARRSCSRRCRCDLLVGGVVVEDRQLALLVNREGGEVEALDGWARPPAMSPMCHLPICTVL